MLSVPRAFRYHEQAPHKFIAKSAAKIVLGTPPTRLKEGKDGFNHPDLAHGALVNFLCWPLQQTIELQPGEQWEIPPFVAYQITGDYEVKGPPDDEVVLSLP